MNQDTVYSLMLKYGYFPDRLKGVLCSEEFGEWILSNQLIVESLDKSHVFRTLSYKATRNNNAPRYFRIMHPVAYCRLTSSVKNNWDKLYCQINCYPDYERTSMIRPSVTNNEKRLFSLASYDKQNNEDQIKLEKQTGAKLAVFADISNCFPSIYTHSIPWALIGKNEAKKRENQECKQWFNELDCLSRNAQDKETLGLPIGSDTSNLIAEIILAQIDKVLVEEGYRFIRFIDDYTCYCNDTKEADSFIATLVRELDKYKLKLNAKKTKIVSLPYAFNEYWVRTLRNLSSWESVNKYNKSYVIDFLDEASDLFRKNPNESPIRYAIKTLSKKKYEDYDTFKLVLQYILNLSVLYPYIIDILGDFIDKGLNNFPQEEQSIKKLLKSSIELTLYEHIQFVRTDAIVWSYAYAIIYGFEIDTGSLENVKKISVEQDDYAMQLMIYIYLKVNKQPIDFIDSDKLTDTSDAWILEYEYRRIEGLIYTNDQFLEKIRKQNISFLDKRILEKL